MSRSINDDFRTDVRDWVAFDDKIAKANRAIKRVRERKKNLGDGIVQFMQSRNLHKKEIKVSNSRLSCNIKEKPTPITQKFIRECLADYFGDEKKAKALVKFMYDPAKKIQACLAIALNDEDQARKATEYLFSQREVTVIRTINRKKKREPVAIPVDTGPISQEATHALQTPSNSSAEGTELESESGSDGYYEE
jgi:hypothetical protein